MNKMPINSWCREKAGKNKGHLQLPVFPAPSKVIRVAAQRDDRINLGRFSLVPWYSSWCWLFQLALHRLRKNSGSLLVHKATHHFDLLNWWVGSEPEEVFAFSKTWCVWKKNSSFRSDKYPSCSYKDSVSFFWDITNDQQLIATLCWQWKIWWLPARWVCVQGKISTFFDQMAGTNKICQQGAGELFAHGILALTKVTALPLTEQRAARSVDKKTSRGRVGLWWNSAYA